MEIGLHAPFFFIAFFNFLVGLVLFLKVRRFISKALTGTGIVYSREVTVNQGTFLTVKLNDQNYNEQTVTVREIGLLGRTKHKENDSIQLLYIEGQPESAKLNTPLSLYLFPFVFFFSSFLMLIVPLFLNNFVLVTI